MDPIEQMLLFAVLFTIVATRGTYVFLITWKWNRMVMSYIEYKDLYYHVEYTKKIAEQAFSIPRRRWLFWKVWIWDAAEDCYNSKHNPRVWFEIVSHWYDNHK